MKEVIHFQRVAEQFYDDAHYCRKFGDLKIAIQCQKQGRKFYERSCDLLEKLNQA